jgi:hypothetical protein
LIDCKLEINPEVIFIYPWKLDLRILAEKIGDESRSN